MPAARIASSVSTNTIGSGIAGVVVWQRRQIEPSAGEPTAAAGSAGDEHVVARPHWSAGGERFELAATMFGIGEEMADRGETSSPSRSIAVAIPRPSITSPTRVMRIVGD